MQASVIHWLQSQPRPLLWLLAVALLLLLALALLKGRRGRSGTPGPQRPSAPQDPPDRDDPGPAAGLVDRSLFDQLLEDAAMQADRRRSPVCVLCVQLDRLAQLDDAGGQGDADRVLAQAAQRLRRCAGVAAVIGRLGAEGFVLLLHGDLNAALRLARDCQSRLARPFTLADDRQLSVLASVGLATSPDHGASSRLVAFASHAAQAAGRAGGDRVKVFTPQMAVDARERADLLADLQLALQAGQFELYYQPQVDARSLQVTAAEALIRWHHPRRGRLDAAQFMPLAEGQGLIADIGHWVIAQACHQAALWREQGLDLRVAINLSGHELRQPGLLDHLQAALQRHGLAPAGISCEIPVAVALDDSPALRSAAQRLHGAGLALCVDDCGVGHSLPDGLPPLAAAELKIAAAWVHGLVHSEQARASLAALVQACHGLGLKVVAEGVETAAQRDQLLALGCDALQGFLFARPMTAVALATWALLDASDADVTAALGHTPPQDTRPVDEP